MTKHPSIRAWFAAALLGAAGCATPPPLEPTPIGQDELDRFLGSAVDARKYGITTYADSAGLRFESANRVHLGQSARMPFVSPKNSPLPIVRAETPLSDPFPVLLDTSARQNWAAMASIRGMEYRLFSPPAGEYPDHVSADIPGYAGAGNKLIFDRLHVEYPTYYVPPARGGLGPLARAGERPDVDARTRKAVDQTARRMPAVVGAALLRSFAFVRFDFPERAVLFSTDRAFEPAVPSAVRASLPLREWKGRPAVQALWAGEPATLVIDTAGDFDVSAPGPVLPDGPLVLGRLAIDDLQLVAHADRGLPETFPARLGLGVLSRFAVTLDYKRQRVWFEEKPLPAPAKSASSPEDEDPAPVHYRGITR